MNTVFIISVLFQSISFVVKLVAVMVLLSITSIAIVFAYYAYWYFLSPIRAILRLDKKFPYLVIINRSNKMIKIVGLKCSDRKGEKIIQSFNNATLNGRDVKIFRIELSNVSPSDITKASFSDLYLIVETSNSKRVKVPVWLVTPSEKIIKLR